MKDIWERIPGFSNYLINPQGVVVNENRNHAIRHSYNSMGIKKVGLFRNGRQHGRALALLVADAFVEGRTEIFDTPIHLNGIRDDCSALNLVWRPRWFAIKFHQQFRFPEFHQGGRNLFDLESGARFDDLITPASLFGLLGRSILHSAFMEDAIFPTGQKFRFYHD